MTQNNAFAVQTCIVVVVVTHESNTASYFFEAVNLNGSQLICVLMWLGRRVPLRAICLSFQKGQTLRTFTISTTASTTAVHLGFERDYKHHTFRGVLRHHAKGLFQQKVSLTSMLFPYI